MAFRKGGRGTKKGRSLKAGGISTGWKMKDPRRSPPSRSTANERDAKTRAQG